MRPLTMLLIPMLILTACAPSTKSGDGLADLTLPAWDTALDRTLMTSLLVSEWREDPAGSVLFPLDPAKGRPLPEYPPIPLGHTYFYAFSPARDHLAVVSFPGENTYKGQLLLIDLPNWKPRPFDLSLNGWVHRMAFSADGERLAVLHGETRQNLTIVDMEQGAIQARQQIDPLVTHLGFTEDGRSLMLYGTMNNPANGLSAGPPEVLLLDARDLSLRWSATLKNVRDGIFPKDESASPRDLADPGQAIYLSPGLAFAPEQELLYIVHADSEQLTTVDFAARQVRTVEVQPRPGWLERLLSLTAGVAHAKIGNMTGKQAVISPDGRFLYVTGMTHSSFQDERGDWQADQTALGLEIIQTGAGTRLESFETNATGLSLSPDGRLLYLRSWGGEQENVPRTDIFDTAARKLVASRAGVSATPALLMNGDFVLVSTYATSETSYRMSVLQPDGKRLLADWASPESVWWLTAP